MEVESKILCTFVYSILLAGAANLEFALGKKRKKLDFLVVLVGRDCSGRRGCGF